MSVLTTSTIRRPRIQAAAGRPIVRHVPHVITVTSGKGGVGKTNLTANLGLLLREGRRRVMVLDADLGLANIDVILGLHPDFNLSHVLSGEKRLGEILTRAPGGLRVLPASSGISSITDLSDAQKIRLLQELEGLQEDFDYLLIDTGAGISNNVIYFNLAAQTIVVVLTPEPTSLTDAYALIKVLSRDYHQRRFKVLANDVRTEAEGLEVFEKLTRVADRFLNVSLDYLGHVLHDRQLRESVRMQRPFVEAFPDGPASASLRKVAKQITAMPHNPMDSDLGLLWRNLLGGPAAAGH
ncbi:MAG TPA: MinD/ParA family protein [Candidatus Sumerlaeota bacterium]|nr:MinD/ParA family protein [Candidatus Sumerlaeota bacterium]